MPPWNPDDPEVLLMSKMEPFVTTVNRISKSYILNAAGVSIYSDSCHPPVAIVLLITKLILLQTSAKRAGTNPSFILT